jgi:hypothetical protein
MYLDGPIGLVHIIPFHIFHLFPIQPFILSLSRNFRLCINGYKSLVLFDVWLKLKTLIFLLEAVTAVGILTTGNDVIEFRSMPMSKGETCCMVTLCSCQWAVLFVT